MYSLRVVDRRSGVEDARNLKDKWVFGIQTEKGCLGQDSVPGQPMGELANGLEWNNMLGFWLKTAVVVRVLDRELKS